MFKKYVIYATWFPLEREKEKLRILERSFSDNSSNSRPILF